MGSNFKLSIPMPTKAPTPNEEWLKLDLLEITRKSKPTIYELYDEILIALRNRGMSQTHKVIIIDEHVVEVIRYSHDLHILRLEPRKEDAHEDTN